MGHSSYCQPNRSATSARNYEESIVPFVSFDLSGKGVFMRFERLRSAAPLVAAIVLLSLTGMAVESSGSASAANANVLSLTPTAVGPTPAIPAGAKAIGALAIASTISATVTLNPADPQALEAYATAVSTPGNALYRHYLTTAQFAADFGPSDAAVASVRAVLLADGLSPEAVSANHLSIKVHGSTATFSSAFSTQFQNYRLATGRVAYANISTPKLAPSIASAVQSVIGLDDLVLLHPQGAGKIKSPTAAPAINAQPQVATGGPQPCAAAVGAGPSNSAYTADQIATAYQFNGLYGAGDFGAGQTIAMFELESNYTSDIAAYQKCYHTSAPIQYVKIDGGTPPSAGEEATLDIENAISIAPKATELVYQGPNNGGSGAYDTFAAIISQNRATVISTSWGLCELDRNAQVIAAENALGEEAASQGQSVFDASGDAGSEDCGDKRLSIDDPAGQPFVTVVGGTTLLNPTGANRTETLWNVENEGAGGAGISRFAAMPTYQSKAAASLHVINANSNGAVCGAPHGSFCRQEPDVSLDADPSTGFLVYVNGRWTGFGGTSGAAPIWAAFTALTNASSTCDGSNVGFLNPALYSIAGSSYAANFTDITSGNSDYTHSHDGLYPTAVGYDIASGIGTPKGATLAASLCGGAAVSPTLLAGSYQVLAPTRILDTRTGVGATKAKVPAHGSLALLVAGRGGVPSLTGPAGSAPSAVDINFTASNADGPGALTVFPTGSTRPNTSNVDFTAGDDVATTTIAKLGTHGSITIYNGSAAPVDLTGDVAGYYLSGTTPSGPTIAGTYQPLPTQTRLLDTTNTGGKGKLAAGRTRLLTVAGIANVPADAASVVLTVTSINATGRGHLQIYAAGSPAPAASNLNFSLGRTVANEVVVRPGVGDMVAIHNGGTTGSTDIVVNVVGYIAGGKLPSAAGLQVTISPSRVLDTRDHVGTQTSAKVAAGGTRVVTIAGLHAVPLHARAAIITVTATNESQTGFATVYAGRNRPTASVVNFSNNTDVANLTIAPIGPDGTITIYNGSSGPTDLIIDLSGYITG